MRMLLSKRMQKKEVAAHVDTKNAAARLELVALHRLTKDRVRANGGPIRARLPRAVPSARHGPCLHADAARAALQRGANLSGAAL